MSTPQDENGKDSNTTTDESDEQQDRALDLSTNIEFEVDNPST